MTFITAKVKSLVQVHRFELTGCPATVTCLLDLFLTNYKLYERIVHSTNTNISYTICPELIEFLDSQKYILTQHSDCYVKKRTIIKNWNRSYSDKTKVHVNSKPKAPKKNEQVSIAELIELTNEGTIQWKRNKNLSLSTKISKKYVSTYKDSNYVFSIEQTKIDGHWSTVADLSGAIGGINKENLSVLHKTIKNHYKSEDCSHNPVTIAKVETIHHIDITPADFVVKTSLFRCVNNKHILEEIVGHIKVIPPNGKVLDCEVPAAYCAECKCFFLLKSEFLKLENIGRIMCQIIEHDEYFKHGLSHTSYATGESILMRNGYNVKQSTGLTQAQRQAILQSIMDNRILGPHKIASYLSTFIAQKRNMPQYATAVQKWRDDKNFVLSYSKKISTTHVNVKHIKITNQHFK